MSRSIKLDADGLRDKRHWPRLPEATQDAFMEFLSYYRAVAEDALSKSAAIAAIAAADSGSHGNAQWWAHVIRTIDWLLHQVPNRQRYLEIKLAMEEKRWAHKAPARAT